MRRTTQHIQSVRERRVGTRVLNFEYLSTVLQYNLSTTRNSSRRGTSDRAKGKKRAAEEALSSSQKPLRKRFKRVPQTENNEEVAPAETWIPVLAYTHTLDIEYSRSAHRVGKSVYVHDEEARNHGWIDEEERLCAVVHDLAALPTTDGPHSLDLGKVELAVDGGILTVTHETTFLMALPSVEPDFALEKHDMRSRQVQDPLVACSILEEAGRAQVSASLRLVILPEDAQDEDRRLPIRFTVNVSVSFVKPAIFEPFLYTTKSAISQVEDAQRRAFAYLFPHDGVPQVPVARHIDVPTLYSAIGPAPSVRAPAREVDFQPAALVPALLPFQRRSTAWLLSRENKYLDTDGNVIDHSSADDHRLPIFWQQIQLADSETWYLNRLTSRVSQSVPEDTSPPGGILAEEPGLGKTLESIALILLNPAVGRNPKRKTWNPETRIFVKDIKTTLIVTPPSLAQQWADELRIHAPSLKVLVYDGWAKLPVPFTEEEVEQLHRKKAREAKSAKSLRAADRNDRKGKHSHSKGKGKGKASADGVDEEEDDILDWCNYVNTFDVCITTYTVLQHDLGIARPPPDRPRRTIATYSNVSRPRSPLVMVEWYRVIMDEVQMVGGGNTEEMVSLIPRLSSFAVSGTPARSKVDDLIHVLNFLRVQQIVESPRLWARLLKPGYRNELIELFTRYSIRTMKAAVKDELTIPKQTRYLVPIELGRVERHVYDQNFEHALLELGLDARGVAVSENWQVDTGTLRYWLRKLRGICTHPQVGQLQNQDKLHKPGVLKTMADVLEGMKDQNWRNLMDNRKQKVHALTVIAQLQQNLDRASRANLQTALATLNKAEREADDLVKDIRTAMLDHRKAGDVLKEEFAAHRVHSQHDKTGEDDPGPSMKGKGRARESEDIESLDDEDSDLPETAAGQEHRIKTRALQQRLRECQITLHRVHFLKGDVHHSLGQSDDENTSYAAAEELRRILLKSTERAAKHAMAQLVHDATEKGVTEDQLLIPSPYFGAGGIRSAHLMEEANEMIADLLNEQGALLWQWRKQLIALLTNPLSSSEDDDADGQEYTRSLDTQGEAEAYLQAYSALLADRREAMTSERTLLAALDVKEKKLRKTKAAKRADGAIMDGDDIIMALDEDEQKPEHAVLLSQLQNERKQILEAFNSDRSMRSIMVDLNNAAARARDSDPEKTITVEATRRLRELLKAEAKLMEELQADLASLRKAFNERISYFRQLQEISDTVAEAEWVGSVDATLKQHVADQAELEIKINTSRARQRYLEHLAKAQGEGTLDEDEEACILCKCEFTRGYITQCAHVFCESCMKAWSGRKDGKSCPVCRTPIISEQLQRFAVDHNKAPEQPAPPKVVNNEPLPKSTRKIEYSTIHPSTMDTIELMESHGSYGSKIQTLVRHLLYIQLVDPGAKSIVFSAWADSLHIIEHALKANEIPSLRIDQTKGKENAAKRFKADPSLQVLLLHGERENAGLNITCASRVFLVESVVHHAFEIQAIARIDRMGQTKPTEVYCYYAEETVERNILDLAARQGLSLYTKDNYAGTLTAGPVTVPGKSAIDEPKKRAQKGDFVFRTDDMLAIFFPHLFEELEYLITPDDAPIPASIAQGGQHWSNAVAGPSRITS